MSTIEEPKLSFSKIWKGCHERLNFEVTHWGLKREHSLASTNDGKGCWNYYVILFEREIENFKDFWRDPEVREFSVGGTKYIRYDYEASPLATVFWHGGATYWQGGTPELVGQRYIKIGCDYSHLQDQERGYDYTIEDILRDVSQTIAELLPLLVWKRENQKSFASLQKTI